MRTLTSVWCLAVTAAALPGCGERIEGCEYTGTCPARDTSSSSGGTGGTGSGGTGGSGGSSSASTTASSTTTSQGGTGGSAGDSTTGGAGGASGGSSGASGAAGSPACDDACEGETPVCDEASDTCVECLQPKDCDEGVCDTDAHACIECLDSEQCEAPTGLCDTEQQLCVECLVSGDCTDPQASFCDSGSCTPCQTNTDCTHLTETTVCDAGQCVACTVAEEVVCGGKSCSPATKTCTETDVGSVDDCQPCAADSECIGGNQPDPDRRCVPMEFQGEPREQGFCLTRGVKTCDRPYLIAITAPSLSGAVAEAYCGIDQDNVTCEAVLDLRTSKPCLNGQNTECGCPRDDDGNCTAPGKGGLCRNFELVANRCTYQCGVDDDCPSGRSCANSTPDFCQ